MPLARLWQKFLKLAGTLSIDRCLDRNYVVAWHHILMVVSHEVLYYVENFHWLCHWGLGSDDWLHFKIKSEEHFVSFFRWNYLCAAQKYRFNVHFPGSIQIWSCRRLAFTAGIGLLWLVFLLVLIPLSCFCLFTFISNRHPDHGDPRLHFHFLSYVITCKMRLIFIGFTTWLWHYKTIKLIFWY